MSDYSEYKRRAKKLRSAYTTVITVCDGKMFRAGHKLKIGTGNEKYIVVSKSGNKLTIAPYSL